MSRALDSETISSASKGDAEKSYTDITRALCIDAEPFLEIEFLGKSHPIPAGTSVLVDGNNIAVSKAKLVQAFVVARQILFRNLKDCPNDQISHCRDASAVMLLMDPEHLTAANFRKGLLVRLRDGPRDEFEALLKKELLLVNSYLTSRLHRHTKSPTLWGHRRWILEFASSHMKVDVLKDLQSVVLVAAERHLKNYYAFVHMRWLIRTYTCSTETLSLHDLPRIIAITKDWCLRHPNDTSGFSFLLFGLSQCQLAKSTHPDLSNMCSVVCTDVLRLAVSFKWTHESVWVFLRTLVAEYGTDSDILAFNTAIDDTTKAYPEGQTVLRKAKDWCAKYQQNYLHKP
ncbi:uncharacterized protein LY89DRAFT_222344 [Mollisia scopiformis]|uniref:Uncharacterized protein n=1 Tax=Mollisia scopiformis TaxID=149040 RepID=A0A194WVX7_MOLSC|nr:uncharacterized protein LY89DRAFT_222344 [Mollisia scopiformis]KUJ12116.1 hypothetical protein LY89DRAFT_222344 [Mollisia scopiformis]